MRVGRTKKIDVDIATIFSGLFWIPKTIEFPIYKQKIGKEAFKNSLLFKADIKMGILF